MQNNQLVLVGGVTWTYSAWHGSFYPDDLPDDWVLSYYNTQFQAVFLPRIIWQSVSESLWLEWLNDTQDGFYFVLESAGEAVGIPTSERVLRASPVWINEHVWWLDDAPDLRALAQRITRQVNAGEPLFVFSRSGDLGLMQQVNQLKQVMGY
ncbi:MAG: hypothetical protein GZ085_03310 [Sulfuriferula multivorans]|uniref:DUF72 domain-containing protein n=1 Tax=Sulfuriferula multivorans TaxID=1559896 RepID=A0A7C9JVS8_9PROT|nr:hypothetical protein [Sulfuriferula multivorans]